LWKLDGNAPSLREKLCDRQLTDRSPSILPTA